MGISDKCDVRGCGQPVCCTLDFADGYLQRSFCMEHFAPALMCQGGPHEQENLRTLLNND